MSVVIPVRRHWAAVFVVAVLCLGAGPVPAAPLNLTLSFASLPSAQGFSYVPSGSHAAVPEASVFSVDGTRLTQDSMGQALGTAGGSIFYQRLNGVTTTETKRIVVRARCTAAEGSASAPAGQGGYLWGFATGSVQYAFGLTPTRISVLQPGGTVLLAGTFDNSTTEHEYIFDWSPGGTWRVYRDGIEVGSGSGGFALAANRVFFGDGTGGANARGEMSLFSFSQDLATAVRPASWAGVKRRFH